MPSQILLTFTLPIFPLCPQFFCSSIWTSGIQIYYLFHFPVNVVIKLASTVYWLNCLSRTDDSSVSRNKVVVGTTFVVFEQFFLRCLLAISLWWTWVFLLTSIVSQKNKEKNRKKSLHKQKDRDVFCFNASVMEISQKEVAERADNLWKKSSKFV